MYFLKILIARPAFDRDTTGDGKYDRAFKDSDADGLSAAWKEQRSHGLCSAIPSLVYRVYVARHILVNCSLHSIVSSVLQVFIPLLCKI